MGSVSSDQYDFIVVGGGPAGSMISRGLAGSAKRPHVLLIEAGGKNDLRAARIVGKRMLTRTTPGFTWPYQTSPQQGLNGRRLDYIRGKGLGGTSAVNFCAWTVGPRDDYDEIARLVDDDEWKWTNVHARYKRIESYHGAIPDIPNDVEKYLSPRPEDHGKDGFIKVGFPAAPWEPDLTKTLDILSECGISFNPDHNCGNPIGLAVNPLSAYKGVRSTAADALEGAPPNLHVLTDVEVVRVVFDGKRAIGVASSEGTVFHAKKEVVLSCGSLDTPRILMHSGIGPEDQLRKFGIEPVQANANVGQNLKDHHHCMVTYARAEHTSTRQHYYRSKELQAAAHSQWKVDQTGPLADVGTALGMAFLKLDQLLATPEFQSLPAAVQAHLQKPTIPNYELVVNFPAIQYFMDPENTPAASVFMIVNTAGQSSGSVFLQSSDPESSLCYDPQFFSHPYDRRVVVEATREVMRLAQSPAFAKDTVGVIEAPKSDSDEDILEFWRQNTSTTYHMTGTARMGRSLDDSVVDKNFKVFGVQHLRVADMSIYPLLLHAHTQAGAYLAGMMLADKLVKEYSLD